MALECGVSIFVFSRLSAMSCTFCRSLFGLTDDAPESGDDVTEDDDVVGDRPGIIIKYFYFKIIQK